MALTMEHLLSEEDVTAIKQARLDVFGVQFDLSDPQTQLVLNRGGIEIDQQAVVVDWVDRRSSRRVGGRAMTEIEADVVFRRPDDLGFDVAKSDRFRVGNAGQDYTGVVTRVYKNKGKVFAEATLDVGKVH